jgi:hypothetical protein
MRTRWTVSVIGGLVAGFLGSEAVAPPPAHGQVREQVVWRTGHIRRCPQADALFGRLWRSHGTTVRLYYSAARDTTSIRPPVRTASWATTSSRLVGTEPVIRVRGRDPRGDSARIEVALRFLDTLYRAPEQATIDLVIDDSVHLSLQDPKVDYPSDVVARGIPLVVTVLLTPRESFELARANKVAGSMGGYPFFFYGWEIWDINAIYRATVCGLD